MSPNLKKFVWTLGVALLCLSFGGPLFAQGYYGALRGLVTDPNSAVIVSAKVTLTNEGTSEQRSALTSGSGEYSFNDIVPGTYTVTCEFTGFKKFERRGLLSPHRNKWPRT